MVLERAKIGSAFNAKGESDDDDDDNDDGSNDETHSPRAAGSDAFEIPLQVIRSGCSASILVAGQ